MKCYIRSSVMVSMLIMIIFGTGGCDVSDPSFIVDTDMTAVVEINEQSTSFDQSATADLSDLLGAVEGTISDINVFNITLQIDRLGNTPENLIVSGAIAVDENTLVSLVDVPISAFENERSIFDEDLADQYDFNVDNDGLQYLLSLFDDLPTVTVGVSGEASAQPVHMRVLTKLHAQVTTE